MIPLGMTKALKNLIIGHRVSLVTVTALALTLFIMIGRNQADDRGSRVVRLGFIPTLTHGPAIIATADGRFRRAFEGLGFTFEPVLLPSGPAIIEAVYARRVDIAYVGPGPAINGFVQSSGEEIAIISGCSANGVAIVGRKGAQLTNIRQLARRKVAVPALGNTQYLSASAWLTSLSKTMLPEGSMWIVPCSPSDAQILLKKGQVDAAWLPEPWPSQLEAEGEAVVLAEEKRLWPRGRFPAAVVVVRRRFLDENPHIVAQFLRIHRDTVLSLQKERERFAPVLASELRRLTKKPLSEMVLRRALERVEFTSEVMRLEIERFYRLSLDCGLLRRAHRIQLDRLFAEVTGNEFDSALMPGTFRRLETQSSSIQGK